MFDVVYCRQRCPRRQVVSVQGAAIQTVLNDLKVVSGGHSTEDGQGEKWTGDKELAALSDWDELKELFKERMNISPKLLKQRLAEANSFMQEAKESSDLFGDSLVITTTLEGHIRQAYVTKLTGVLMKSFMKGASSDSERHGLRSIVVAEITYAKEHIDGFDFAEELPLALVRMAQGAIAMKRRRVT